MATKSVLKCITVKDKDSCFSLVSALEHAKKKKAKEVKMTRPVRKADKDLIQKMFKEK